MRARQAFISCDNNQFANTRWYKRAGTLKLALRALLEVVQSGAKNVEVALLARQQPLRYLSERVPASLAFYLHLLLLPPPPALIHPCLPYTRTARRGHPDSRCVLCVICAQEIDELLVEINRDKEQEAADARARSQRH